MGKEFEQIIIAGFGGQGVLFLGKVLAQVGMAAGKNVSWIPSYGPEMRGGTANCTVVISDDPIASPIVAEPDTVLAMNRPSVTKFLPKISKGGTLIYNSSLIPDDNFRHDVNVHAVPASKIADDLGNPKVANLVMVGAYVKHNTVLDYELVLQTLPKLIPTKQKELAQVNRAAFIKGYEIG